ncbi:MAG TPA: hypothetical protein VJJ21_02265 [Candidatus Nanoarchaeia archaeon]|nr:hypothetical protein [Candidatus Nanoarchaeia archaeon]
MIDYYELLKNRNAIDLFSSVEYQLAIRSPDAKENHRRDQLRMELNSHISVIEMYHFPEYTLEQYCLSSSRARKSLSLMIQRAVEEFKVNIGIPY